ncbi:MAG: hypothetical protein AABZ02_10180 [Bacteroidota bacterium]
MIRYFNSIAIIAVLVLGVAAAQEENSLTRDEVALIKRRLVSVLDALGQPQAALAGSSLHYATRESYAGKTHRIHRRLHSQ